MPSVDGGKTTLQPADILLLVDQSSKSANQKKGCTSFKSQHYFPMKLPPTSLRRKQGRRRPRDEHSARDLHNKTILEAIKTQHDALSQEVGKHGARINTRWRSFTSKERAQCLSTINGTKSPQNRKETFCEDIFFDIPGVSLRLRDIISDPEVLLSWLECHVAGTAGGQVR